MTFDALHDFLRCCACGLPALLNLAKYVSREPITAVGFFIGALAGIASGVRIGAGNAYINDCRSAARVAIKAFYRKYFAVADQLVCVVFDADNLIADQECYIFHVIVSLIQITARPL